MKAIACLFFIAMVCNAPQLEAQTLLGKIANKVQQTISRSANTSKSNTSQIHNSNPATIQQNTNTTKANPVTSTASLPKDSNQNTRSDTKNETANLSTHETPTWVTIDSSDFIMKYPSNWDISISPMPYPGMQPIIFMPPNDGEAKGSVQVLLTILNLSASYPNNTKSELRQLELNFVTGGKDIDDPENHNKLPDVTTDSSVRQTIYKDLRVLKIFLGYKRSDGQSTKIENDDYSLENRTIILGYECTPTSSYDYYKTIIETMLKSFQLKSNGILLPDISKNKQPIISHNYIVKAKPKPKPKNSDVDKIYDKVDIDPQFSGGSGGWNKFLRDSLRTDFLQQNNAPKGKYAVTVSFVVSSSGISEVKALNDPGYGTAQEAVRLIQSTSNERGPGFHSMAQLNGHAVNCRTKKTITFEVDE